ncbi:hypothetical protein M3Y99_00744200 [Aphelenchoides fujianensis]|nr:hypothetical protein M3Y99_00744200 [Aphelenchoides fujianensis]
MPVDLEQEVEGTGLSAEVNRTPVLRSRLERLDSPYHLDCNSLPNWRTFFDRWIQQEPSLRVFSVLLQPLDMTALSQFALIDLPAQYGARSIVHGDCWTNNLLLRKPAVDLPPTEIRGFIDFQLAFFGNPLFDLARFLQICVDAEERRAMEAEIVGVYFEELERACAPEPPPFPREQAEALYEMAAIHQSIHLVLCLFFLGGGVRDDEQKTRLTERLRAGLADGVQRMRKHGIFERFGRGLLD